MVEHKSCGFFLQSESKHNVIVNSKLSGTIFFTKDRNYVRLLVHSGMGDNFDFYYFIRTPNKQTVFLDN